MFDEIYIGRQIEIEDNRIIKIGVDRGMIIDDKNTVLATSDIHTCIAVLVIGSEQIGMCHLDIQNGLTLNQQHILRQLLKIEGIKEIDAFTGPKTSIESLNKLRRYIRFNEYSAYINNPLGLNVATGNIAYDASNEKLYGYNDDGFVEYKKGYINALNSEELVKKSKTY